MNDLTNKLKHKYVHLVLGSKGGIGKTYITCYLTEYLKSVNQMLTVVDTDTANTWLKETKYYNTVPFPLFDSDNLISFERMPEIFRTFQDRNIVIDTGANSYSAWYEFLSNGGDEEIQVYGSKLIIHVPVTSGSSFNECIKCLEQLVEKDFNCRYAIWLNNSVSPKSDPLTEDDFCAQQGYDMMHRPVFITQLPRCNPLQRKLVNELHDRHYALSELANATDDELGSYTLFDRPAGKAEKLRAQYYLNQILSSFDNDICSCCFSIEHLFNLECRDDED